VTIDDRNRAFWDEACGTVAASSRGLNTSAEFDRWFFQYYPFLNRYITAPHFAGRRVLEVGLGYGSVGQRLIDLGADYVGLDIAAGPIRSLRQRQIGAAALQGSVLALPFQDGSFDAVVSIGCIHHTGNIALAIAELFRVLRPGGHALLMVYNAANYVEWIKRPLTTARYVLTGTAPRALTSAERAEYDMNSENDTAPETVLVSGRVLRKLVSQYFPSFTIRRENCVDHRPIPRRVQTALIGPMFGLNLYVEARK
jgi:SAM-dependent methyltransferase